MLKRSGFRRPTIERKPVVYTPIPESQRRSSMAMVGGKPADVMAKHQYIRSPALMKVYRLIPCQHCGREDGTVCGAHSNQLSDHKGRGIKSDDNTCASLCAICHGDLDQGSRLSREERIELHSSAMHKTVRELLKRGLWPLEIPLPDIRRMN